MNPASGPKREQWFRVGLAVLAIAVWTAVAAINAQDRAADFDVFWAAARHWRAPYDPALVTQLKAALHIKGALPFVYPPTFLLAAWPFGLLPLKFAFPLWSGISAGLFILAASFVVRPVWAALALFIVPPVVLAIAPGQTSLLVGAAAMAGFTLKARRPALAGLLFAAAACIKPQAMILAPIVLWGDWRVLRWALIGGLSLILASFVFGPALWPQWLHALGDFAGVMPRTDRINPSVLFAGPGWMATLALLGVWLAWRSRDMAGLVCGALCLTPYAHEYDLAPLAPLALSWLIGWKTQGWSRALAGAALLAGFVASPLAALVFLVGLGLAAATPWKLLKIRPEPPLTQSYEA
jgi:hypothetical protein